jgi:YegS/Rv2252/BmrU family lipid kinase
MSLKVAIVFNARSGSLLGQAGEEIGRSVERRFAEAGFETALSLAEGGEIPLAAERAAEGGAAAVIVGGGDGTILSVASRLIDTDTALGVLPLGTANLLARDLDIPLTLDEAVTALLSAGRQRIDVAEVNGEPFLNNAVLGLYAKLARERERSRGRMTLWRWVKLIARALRMLTRYPRLRMRVDFGQGPRAVKAMTLTVSNNVYDGGFRAPFKRSRLDRRELGVYIAKHKSIWSLLRFGAEILTGNWVRDRDLESATAETLTVDAKPRRLRITADGELRLMTTPLVFRIRPAALTVLVPKARLEAGPEPQDGGPPGA